MYYMSMYVPIENSDDMLVGGCQYETQ